MNSGGKGMIGIPAEAKDVEKEDLKGAFPPKEILQKWHKGEEAEWPPIDDYMDDFDDMDNNFDNEFAIQRPPLRFEVGQAVQCRVGPDPVTGWADGIIIQLWYRETGWPTNSWAPYKIELDDGRRIFAPGDVDQIIRAK